MTLRDALDACPFVAILRGVRPEEAAQIGAALWGAGVRLIEVPLNSPDPFVSIERLADAAPAGVTIGAGTVLAPEEVDPVVDAGGALVVAPNLEPAVVRRAREREVAVLPGVATPTEAFRALGLGADGLKLFPGEALPPPVVKAWRAVLPAKTLLLPVGGVTPASVPAWRAAGADGFGVGSALYAPGRSAREVADRTVAFLRALDAGSDG